MLYISDLNGAVCDLLTNLGQTDPPELTTDVEPDSSYLSDDDIRALCDNSDDYI